ncbi:MAG: methionine adenosyltransferase [Myxococcales bacterium]|nr:MAG: methionine adenosyltransferase [Myxococcales bacterium]
MSQRPHVFTSESVTEGHPDKIADQISDAILDAILSKDPQGRVAIECLLKSNLCIIAGEVSSHAQLNYAAIAREVIKNIGYRAEKHDFDARLCTILTSIDEQSKDIALGVDASADKEQGAGDQGMMFGYACDETPEFMPLSITYAHALAQQLASVRKRNVVPFLGPDGKTQVTVEYEQGRPKGISTLVISSQHDEGISQTTIKEAIIEEVIKPIVKKEHLLPDIKFHINPTGAFVIGGPVGDSGLTGRKIIVDTYGGMGRHGGGAFSGKDPSKVDRSAAYLARYIAKNVVAAGLARQCEVQLAYAIGESNPVSVMLNTFGTAVVDESKIEDVIKTSIPLKPAGLIEYLDLRKPIYQKTATYGHFGRNDIELSWEQISFAQQLKQKVL